MSIDLTTTITIDATTDEVWDVLTDFASYGAWSNFSSIEGAAVEGTRLKVRMPGLSFRPVVTAAAPGTELQWAAKVLTPRLFHGQHSFRLSANPDGTTLLANSEVFSGVTVAPFRRLLEKRGKSSGYAAFNQALKARVEAVAQSGTTGPAPTPA